jgi:hypothetical protein
VAQFRVRRGSVHGAVWLCEGGAWPSTGCGMAQIDGCSVAQLRMRRGSVDRVRRGSLRVQRDSVQGAA